MTTYYVDRNAGGASGTLPSLAAAMKLVAPGDEVIVRPGVYAERLVCDTPDVTWRSETPLAAIIDGGWDGGPVQNEYTAMISVLAPGVVVRNFAVRNSPSRGIAISADRAAVWGNSIDNCYGGGVIASECEDILIWDNVLRRLGMSWTTGKHDMVSGSMNLIRVARGRVIGNQVSGGHGEGINCGKGSQDCIVENNIVNDCAHLAFYFNRCLNSTMRGNIAVLTMDADYEQGEPNTWPAAFVFGDEVAPDRKGQSFPYQRGNALVNNLAVGYGTLVHVRNNKRDPNNPYAGYDTQLLDCVIENNTLVAGPGTRAGIVIQENLRGRPHANTVVRHNVIHFDHAQAGAEIGRMSGPGVTFGRNAWTRSAPANMAGDGDVVGDLKLVNAGAAVEGSGASGLTLFDIDNYRPHLLSPIIGAGTNGETLGALAAVSEPPPPDVDWGTLLAEARAGAQEMVDLTAHGLTMAGELAEINRHGREALARLDALIAALEREAGGG